MHSRAEILWCGHVVNRELAQSILDTEKDVSRCRGKKLRTKWSDVTKQKDLAVEKVIYIEAHRESG